MRALAEVLHHQGAVISGIDLTASSATQQLSDLGLEIRVGEQNGWIPTEAEMVVATAAAAPDNPQLLTAESRGLPLLKYSEMLGQVMCGGIGIAIAGTHGKSTTTAMVSFVLRCAGLEPTFVVGADVPQLGGPSGVGAGSYFVAEACEFDRSFHHLRPRMAAILNIEEDHLDCYACIEEIIESFAAFARQVDEDGMIAANGDDPRVPAAIEGVDAEVQTFGFSNSCDWRADELRLKDGTYSFAVVRHGDRLGSCRLGIAGKHNVMNALAAIAVSVRCGMDAREAIELVGRFEGADRRLSLRARTGGVTILDDYAHHPTEVRATLQAARECHAPERVWCVFQPHQHSRTRFLLDDFAASFGDADVVIAPDIYFVRDSEQWKQQISSEDLVNRIIQNGKDAYYIPKMEKIADYVLDRLRPNDLLITMGAGDVWKIGDDVAKRFK
jgi:UDP-N-acetylmuramate--alanine ligase